MELLNSSVSINCQISCNFPFSSCNFPFIIWKNKKHPSRVTVPNSRRPSLLPQFILRLPRSKKFQVSAHFGRPSSRQNYLRKKLTERKQQVNDLDNRKFNENDISESNFDTYGKENSNLDKMISLDKSFGDNNNGEYSSVIEPETESRRKILGESVLWNKLESWVEQYKKDTEMWGIGTGPIFTVFQDNEGKIKRVVVNEDEILRRSQVNPGDNSEAEDLTEVNFKLSFAKDLAREMERSNEVIPKNSSVVKFVMSGEKSGFLDGIQGVKIKPGTFSRMSRVGFIVVCGLFVVWAVKGLFTFGKDSEEYTRLEKEMLRRKMKARMEKEKMVKGSVEVMQDSTESISVSLGRPRLDKEEVVNSIIKANVLDNEFEAMEYSGYKPNNFNDKIEEIRAMARHARELEQKGSSEDNSDGEDGGASSHNDPPNGQAMDIGDSERTSLLTSFGDLKENIGHPTEEASIVEIPMQICNMSNSDGKENTTLEISNRIFGLNSSDLNELNSQSDKSSVRTKLRVIKSVKEAREYLSRNNDKAEVNQEHVARIQERVGTVLVMPSTNQASDESIKLSVSTPLSGRRRDSRSEGKEHASANNGVSEVAEGKKNVLNNLNTSRMSSGHEASFSGQNRGHEDSSLSEKTSTPHEKHNSEDTENIAAGIDLQMPQTTNINEVNSGNAKVALSGNKENWIEKNFHEFEPIVQKIGAGYRDNYWVARENTNQDLELKSLGDDNELEWMKDERLRDIVFKVRENELSGRDPFYLIDEEDKRAFFSGLEKKVEQENEKLLNLHKYFHSNIENLDYGADGISLYDPPEKIIPRWKVPPAENNPEFLNNFIEQRKEFVAESIKNSFLAKKTEQDVLQKSEEPSSHDNMPRSKDVSDGSTKLRKEPMVSSKTIIEGSDGSMRAGKKSGREYWHHTKKWSQGFLESYNAETDPEVKGVMRDMGKDLDRWITDKEIQEVADLMDKIPEKGREFVKGKLDKVKREMELFGPQAVVSKYREYAEEKEEDYLWWLDLPFVLCIELYTVENGEQRVGFYSLEMAADLELDPKQYHVIAFEDAGDCKNLCYIIQDQMEILGNGNAFVVARPPKDAFREAKANGFSVTVIRKGQLQLNVDQTLEEVEELIGEIGSKIYHDKIMQDRSVDINGLMKGVFGFNKPAKRKRSKRKLKKRTKL